MKAISVFREAGLLAVSGAGLGVPGQLGESHLFHEHVPVWSWCNPNLANPYPPEYGMPDVFAFPGPGTTVAQAASGTRFLVFLGARMSRELALALADPNLQVFVFEPDVPRMEAFLAGLDPVAMAQAKALFFCGEPDNFFPPLLAALTDDFATSGYPVFFAQEGLARALPEYVRRVTQLVEIFYYRHAIYPFDGQEYHRGLPIRPMLRNAIYDRVKHSYENMVPCLTSGILDDLRGALPGQTAILAAAGPALQDRLEFIRHNLDRTVVIAVNSALKPLLAAGIEPHFVVINDTSVDSEASFTGLAPLKRAILVGHCLSGSGQGVFERMYFFGNYPGQPFRMRDGLLLHGSVITTAFALAEYLGCSTAILTGVQLASADPRILNYSPNSPNQHHKSGMKPENLRHKFPELYPARAADGSTQFTSLNFFDAAQWFADRIRLSRLKVINVTAGSILQGPHITYDPDVCPPPSPDLALLLARLPRSSSLERRERVSVALREAMAVWKNRERLARSLAQEALSPQSGLERAEAFIAACDQDNTSFMVQRFEDFDNALFHGLYFDSPNAHARRRGAAYFCSRVERMCKALVGILLGQHKALEALKT